MVDLLVLKGEMNEGVRYVRVLRISAVCCTLCPKGGKGLGQSRDARRCAVNVQVDI